MNQEDQADKWNNQYAKSGPLPKPAWVLTNNQHLLPSTGSALDLACGLGANSIYMAQRGLSVTAWDISQAAITKLKTASENIEAEVRDVESNPPRDASFDVICVVRYLSRSLCPAIELALKPGGILIYQTFTKAGIRHRQKGPSSPDYLLEDGELPRLFPSLKPVFVLDDSQQDQRTKGLEGQACMVARASG